MQCSPVSVSTLTLTNMEGLLYFFWGDFSTWKWLKIFLFLIGSVPEDMLVSL